MSDSVIAIRTADRKLVPVLSGSEGVKQRVVLTTVHENQSSVHIDLFQMESEVDEQSDYIGSLVIEHLKPAAAGQPDISLTIGIDEQGNLNATASDSSSGDYQSLSVSLRDAEGAMQDMPDFSLSEEESFDDFDLSGFDEPGIVDFEDSTDEEDDEDGHEFAHDEDTDDEDDVPAFDDDVPEFGDDDQTDEPDFSFDESEDDPFELPDLEDDAAAEPVSVDETVRTPVSEASDDVSVPRLLFVAYIVLAIAILTGLVFIVYRLLEGDPVPPLEAFGPLAVPAHMLRPKWFRKGRRSRFPR